LEIILNHTENSSLTDSGPFQLGNKWLFNYQKSIVDKYKHEWLNKKGLFVPGGVGRLANYAISIGLNVDCMDASAVCEGLCKLEYPKVTFIKANFMQPIDGYDFILFEDLITTLPMIPINAYAINNWQNERVKIYPKFKSYSIFRFNSSILDDRFYQFEETGKKYVNKLLSTGSVVIWLNPSEVEDLQIEKITIDLNKPLGKFTHLPFDNLKYTAIAYSESSSEDKIRLRLFNSGFNKNFQTNQQIVYSPSVPEKSNYRSIDWLSNSL